MGRIDVSVYRELYRDDAVKYGCGRVSGYELLSVKEEIPFWADCVPDFRRVGTRELELLGWGNFIDAFFFTSYYLECKTYLPLLLERFRSQGGKVQKRKLNNLDELAGLADVIVNCSGLASYHLVEDKSCFPIRGQVYKVRAPFQKFFVSSEDHYIYPNHDVVTLSGTHQVNNWNTTVDKNDSKNIWEGVTSLVPSLIHATVLGEHVGLRPGRSTIRLETKLTPIAQKIIPVVHNYGHGGCGVTLHHGCARDAASLAKDALHKKATSARL